MGLGKVHVWQEDKSSSAGVYYLVHWHAGSVVLPIGVVVVVDHLPLPDRAPVGIVGPLSVVSHVALPVTPRFLPLVAMVDLAKPLCGVIEL